MSVIYFDNNSTVKPHNEVVKVFNEIVKDPLNNLSIHQLGRKAEHLVEEARQQIKSFVGGQSYDVIFTASATEASNLAIFGINVENIIISKIEHAAIYNCRPSNKRIFEVGVDNNGIIDIAAVKNLLDQQQDGNFLLALMLANNETGAIQPVKEIAKTVHQKGGLIFCDIVQALGKIEIDLEDLNVDLASISAHKIGGLQGVGALLVKKGLELSPIIFGGGQEKGKRAGTLNIAAIAAFAKACEISAANLVANASKVKELRDYLEKKLLQIAQSDVQIFSSLAPRLPNSCFFATKNCQAQTQLMQFDLNNICVSAGATCSSGSLALSRVLQSMQIDKNFVDCAIRVSLNADNNKDEINKFIEIWQKIYEKNKYKTNN